MIGVISLLYRSTINMYFIMNLWYIYTFQVINKNVMNKIIIEFIGLNSQYIRGNDSREPKKYKNDAIILAKWMHFYFEGENIKATQLIKALDS